MAEELPKELPKLLPILEQKIDDLKKKFERFFAGLEKRPPLRERDKLKRIIFSIVDKKGYPYHILYRAKQLAIKFNTYNTMWDRMLRQIEEGTLVRDLSGKLIMGPSIKKEKTALEEWVSVKQEEPLEKALEKLYERAQKESQLRGTHFMPREKFIEKMRKQLEPKHKQARELKLKIDFSQGKPKIKVKKEK